MQFSALVIDKTAMPFIGWNAGVCDFPRAVWPGIFGMLIRLLDHLPGKRGCEVFAFKIEVMLSGIPSRAKAETERSRSIS